MSVAAGEEDGLLAVNDHWEVEHRAHEAGAEMPVEEGDEHSGKNSNVTSTHKWTTSHRQKSFTVMLMVKKRRTFTGQPQKRAMRRQTTWPRGCFPADAAHAVAPVWSSSSESC